MPSPETGTTQSLTVKKDLKVGNQYRFRVSCENRAGHSGPSDPTPFHHVRAKAAPPKIDTSTLGQKVAKIGETLVVKVNVTGEPGPEIFWYYRGAKIQSSDTVSIKTTLLSSTLTISQVNTISHLKREKRILSGHSIAILQCSKSTAGKYTVMAANHSGEDTAKFEVSVKGKASPPGGPLQVTNVTARSCHLKWNPCPDNGGSPSKSRRCKQSRT